MNTLFFTGDYVEGYITLENTLHVSFCYKTIYLCQDELEPLQDELKACICAFENKNK